ncbi:hypothetical protein HYT56_00570 [Candidatus Woesearchaeota archaeon]|nr:hypothetical protein [Candidatus Woesearchaeota archaeon]
MPLEVIGNGSFSDSLNVTNTFRVGAGNLLVDSSGKVGIGTATPAGKLHLFSSSASVSPSANADNLVIEDSSLVGLSLLSTIDGTLSIYFGDAGSNNHGQINVYGSDAGANAYDMSFFTQSAERLRIDSSGDIGIGTNSPSAKLDIAGSGNIDLNVSGNLYVNSTNIGIGTAAPTQELTVIGDVNITQGLNLSRYTSCTALETDSEGNLVCGNDESAAGDLSNYATVNESETFTGNLTIQEGLEISNSSAISVPWLNITDGAGGQKFIIDTAGSVGIGTTAPVGELNVIGDVNITGGLNLSQYTTCVLETDGSGNLLCGEDALGGGGEGVWATTANTIYNDTDGVNVGIGLSSPTTKLEINGSFLIGNGSGSPIFQVNQSLEGVAIGRNATGDTLPNATLHMFFKNDKEGYGGENNPAENLFLIGNYPNQTSTFRIGKDSNERFFISTNWDEEKNHPDVTFNGLAATNTIPIAKILFQRDINDQVDALAMEIATGESFIDGYTGPSTKFAITELGYIILGDLSAITSSNDFHTNSLGALVIHDNTTKNGLVLTDLEINHIIPNQTGRDGYFSIDQVTEDYGGAILTGAESTGASSPMIIEGFFSSNGSRGTTVQPDPDINTPAIMLIGSKAWDTAFDNSKDYLADNETLLQVTSAGGGSGPATQLKLFTIKGSGFVGIGNGTTDPQGMLEISNATELSVPWLNITDGAGGQKFIINNDSNIGIGTDSPTHKLNVIGDANITNELIIGNNNFSNSNVGIGTLTPEQNLVVSSAASTTINVTSTATNANAVLHLDTKGLGNPIIRFTEGQLGGLIFLNSTASSSENILFLDDGGSVGIGTTSVITGGSTELSVDGIISVQDNTPSLGNKVDSEQGIIYRDTNNLMVIDSRDAGTLDSTIDLRTSGASRVFIDSDTNNGKVGIGTTAPTHTLNVVGGVNITEDLFVQGQNMTVPDYVFEAFFDKETFMKENKGTLLADYELASISELAQYIKENNQLPPSKIQGQFALDKASNNIVQQQYYLLEKAEEQTIYILQLNDKLEQQQEQLEILNKKLHTIESQTQPNPGKPTPQPKQQQNLSNLIFHNY